MLEAYRKHVEERAALGIVPQPLNAEQTAGLVELLKNPPAGEEAFLAEYNKVDTQQFNEVNPVEYYIELQNRDFVQAVQEHRTPLVTGQEGRKTVEMFTALYRSRYRSMAVRVWWIGLQ